LKAGKASFVPGNQRKNCSGSNMQLLCLRSIPSIDVDTLVLSEAKQALFRDPTGFVLYQRGYTRLGSEESVVRLSTRDALLWLNCEPEDEGSFWLEGNFDA
jgi:hypothetical protein